MNKLYVEIEKSFPAIEKLFNEETLKDSNKCPYNELYFIVITLIKLSRYKRKKFSSSLTAKKLNTKQRIATTIPDA